LTKTRLSYYTKDRGQHTKSYVSNVFGNSSVGALEFPRRFLVAEQYLRCLLILPSTLLELLATSQFNTQYNRVSHRQTSLDCSHDIPGLQKAKFQCFPGPKHCFTIKMANFCGRGLADK